METESENDFFSCVSNNIELNSNTTEWIRYLDTSSVDKLTENQMFFMKKYEDYDMELVMRSSTLYKGTHKSFNKATYALTLLCADRGVDRPKLFESKSVKDKWKQCDDFEEVLNLKYRAKILVVEYPNTVLKEKEWTWVEDTHGEYTKQLGRDHNRTKEEIQDLLWNVGSDKTKKRQHKIKVVKKKVEVTKYKDVLVTDMASYMEKNNLVHGVNFNKYRKVYETVPDGKKEVTRKEEIKTPTKHVVKKSSATRSEISLMAWQTVKNRGSKYITKKKVEIRSKDIKNNNYYELLGAEVNLDRNKKGPYGIDFNIIKDEDDSLRIRKIEEEEFNGIVRTNTQKGFRNLRKKEGFQSYVKYEKGSEISIVKPWQLTLPTDKTIGKVIQDSGLAKNLNWCHRHGKRFKFLSNMTIAKVTKFEGKFVLLNFREFRGNGFYEEPADIIKILNNWKKKN